MKILLLSLLMITGCATTSPPTLQEAMHIQLQREYDKEQQKRIQDMNNEEYINNILKN